MTILQVASGTSVYGGEKILLSLSEYLKNKGHRIIVLSPGQGSLVDTAKSLGYDVAVIPLKKTYDIIAVARLYRLIKRENVDIVHSNGLLVNILSRAACILSGCKSVNTIHVIQHLTGAAAFTRKIRNFYYRMLDNFTAGFCRKIIAVSEAVAADLVKQGLDKNKILTVPNGIEDTDKTTIRNRDILRRFGIGEKDRIVGIVGRIVPIKGHDDFITCAKYLSADNPAIKFIIAGEELFHGGRYSDFLKDRIRKEGLADRIIFTGFLENIGELMANFDVLTVPAWEEPFGLVILEAMSYGVPVVGTGTGGIPEIIQDGKNGMLVPPHSPKALAEAVMRILSNRDFAMKLAQGGLERVKYYTAERMAKAVEEIYINI